MVDSNIPGLRMAVSFSVNLVLLSCTFAHCLKMRYLGMSAVFDKLRGFPCGSWEEEMVIYLDVELNDTPRWSDEEVIEALIQVKK